LNRERDPIPNIFHSIDEEDKKHIILDASFIVNGRKYIFDFISTSDYQSIERMLNTLSNVSSGQNKALNKIQNIDTSNKSINIDELKNTFTG
jgi:hypothetical protein